ncbi:alkaline phosphatase [Kangiella sp. TOML190]|uniref:alkaline phosphatase D family protein n=1 Tax=Kangiella sp. TOML190 TaxID=2931351 RepID=UPI00203C1482|nr:alkaline phosphatase D family protein [Kangiella sp. TOML190]
MAFATSGIGLLGLSGCQELGDSLDLSKAKIDNTKASDYFPQSLASGDPKADSVILWTRVEDAQLMPREPLELVLQVAADKRFSNIILSQKIKTDPLRDGCVKVKVSELEASNYYFYRFLYRKSEQYFSSKIGRTKTAPRADEQRSIKIAQVSCQDYVGKFYNTYLQLLEIEDLDFVLFLGDYIYETTRDPRFQRDNGRSVEFRDLANAIKLGAEQAPFYAANSLDNYRQLYQIYRSDSILQKLHEQFPIIATWDDHEFADDSFGTNATHSGGRQNESNLERKLNSEMAYYEYMPLDLEQFASDKTLLDTERLYPNTKIYRQFNFGKNLDLMVTDFRTHRPDHLIPEDAFPASIIFNQTTLELLMAAKGISFEKIKPFLMPYLDIDEPQYDQQKNILIAQLTEAYQEQGLAQAAAKQKALAKISGNLAVPIINQWLEQYQQVKAGEGSTVTFSAEWNQKLPLGFCYALLGKINLFGAIGARYFVVKDSYDLVSAISYGLNSQLHNPLGEEQERWLKKAVARSKAKWKLVANSVSMNSLVLDLSKKELKIPKPFNQRFYLNVDHWDAFPQKRHALLAELSQAENLVLLSGDIHAALIGQHTTGAVEFTTPSVSSSTQRKMISDMAAKHQKLSAIPNVDQMLKSANQSLKEANPQLKFAEMARHGLTVLQVNADNIIAELYLVPEESLYQSYYQQPQDFLNQVTKHQFTVTNDGLKQLS